MESVEKPNYKSQVSDVKYTGEGNLTLTHGTYSYSVKVTKVTSEQLQSVEAKDWEEVAKELFTILDKKGFFSGQGIQGRVTSEAVFYEGHTLSHTKPAQTQQHYERIMEIFNRHVDGSSVSSGGSPSPASISETSSVDEDVLGGAERSERVDQLEKALEELKESGREGRRRIQELEALVAGKEKLIQQFGERIADASSREESVSQVRPEVGREEDVQWLQAALGELQGVQEEKDRLAAELQELKAQRVIAERRIGEEPAPDESPVSSGASQDRFEELLETNKGLLRELDAVSESLRELEGVSDELGRKEAYASGLEAEIQKLKEEKRAPKATKPAAPAAAEEGPSQRDLKRAQRENASLRLKLKEAQEQFDAKRKELQEGLDAKVQNLKDAEKRAAKQGRELAQLREDLSEQEAIRAEWEEKNLEVRRIQAQLKDQEALQGRLEELNRALSSAEADLQATQGQLAGEEGLKRELEQLRRDKAELEQGVNAVTAKVAEVNRMGEAFEKKLAERGSPEQRDAERLVAGIQSVGEGLERTNRLSADILALAKGLEQRVNADTEQEAEVVKRKVAGRGSPEQRGAEGLVAGIQSMGEGLERANRLSADILALAKDLEQGVNADTEQEKVAERESPEQRKIKEPDVDAGALSDQLAKLHRLADEADRKTLKLQSGIEELRRKRERKKS